MQKLGPAHPPLIELGTADYPISEAGPREASHNPVPRTRSRMEADVDMRKAKEAQQSQTFTGPARRRDCVSTLIF